MTPKRQVIEALKNQLAPLIPDHGRYLEITLPNQALRSERDTPYINISQARDEISSPTPKSRDHRVQVSVARITQIQKTTEQANDDFELNVFGLIDEDPTLGGLVHRCRPISVQPTRVDDQLAGHEIMLEIFFSYTINV